ncbi:MAG: phytanoyl-CoA dioxygenase family protein [Alphaproteobacteria bacterium]|nr:phytanoyl-CoA dioxygenase family protein [Alphaproteobacteria bacterium]
MLATKESIAQPLAAPARAAEPTRDLETAKRDLTDCGYAIVLDALAPDRLAALRQRIEEQAAAEREAGIASLFGGDYTGMPGPGMQLDGAPNQRLAHLVNKGSLFREHLRHPLIRELVPFLLGDNFMLTSICSLIMGKGGSPQMLHSDQGYVPFPTPVPVACNIIWMMCDFTEENGATRLVPGSHRWPPPPLSFVKDDRGETRLGPDPAETVRAIAPAGSALVFDARLWHGGGANRTDTPRPGLNTAFCLPFIRQQDNMPVSLRQEVYEDLTEEEKRLFGFEALNRSIGRMADALGRTNSNWWDNGAGELRPKGSAPSAS